MRKINWFICSLFICSFVFLLSCTEIFGQKTLIYSKPDIDYRTGLDLFEKQQYGSAQKEFETVINAIENGELRMENINAKQTTDDVKKTSIMKSNAEYYYAICAAELLNDDAEQLLVSFVTKNSESPKVPLAYFELAKLQSERKNLQKQCSHFLKLTLTT